MGQDAAGTWWERPLWQYVVAGVVLGLLADLAGVSHVAGLGLVVYLLAVALAVLAGISAQHLRQRPFWAGIATGAAFGLPIGVRAMTVVLTAGELRKALKGRTSPVPVSQLVRVANSPATHVEELIISMAEWAVVGLVAAAVAGAIAGRRDQARHGV
jgi:hypothetical protein